MEEIMIDRLRLIINQIQDFTVGALSYCKEIDDVADAEISYRKLETAINRFTSELHNYFNRSLETSADDISSFSEIQLKGEEVLSELAVKIKIVKDTKVVSQSENKNVMSGKLPKLGLPEYSGDVLEWHQFWDQFESNIGSRNLADVDKLLYLKSSLKGDAMKAIEGLETTNRNYDIAVSTLKSRYGKENHIIDAHYAALYRVKTPTGRDIREVRATLNEIERHLRVLKSLNEDINHNHLRFLILEKMPSEIVYELKLKANTESIEEIRQQLETIISAREDANRVTKDSQKEEYTTQNFHVRVRGKEGNPNRKQNFKQKRWNNIRLKMDNIKREVKREEDRNDHQDSWRKQLKRKPEEQYRGRREFSEKKKRKLQCIFCQEAHFNDQCKKFKTLQERKDHLRGRCYRCFTKGHNVATCKREIYCSHCKKKGLHNRALCPRTNQTKIESTNTLHSSVKGSTVLQTAIVSARNDSDRSKNIQCRVLLDSGSQRSYVTQAIAKKLKLPVEEESKLSVFTFGSKTPQIIDSDIVRIEIRTQTKDTFVIFANVIPYISQNIPYTHVELGELKDNITLADDGSMSSNIDVLIGNDYYFSTILQDKIKLEENLFLIDSKFGWILTGKMSSRKDNGNLTAITYFHSVENKLTPPDLPLNNINLKCLWELESIGICDSPKITRDEEAVRQFNDTIEFIDNRYNVCWPWIEYPPDLPTNFGLAFGRLVNLLKRINSETLSSYDTTLKEQMEMGIIEVVPEDEIESANLKRPVHYLPHHGVSQPGKPTRIVYDASAKLKDKRSLNECLYCGPLMLEDLTGLIIKFRCHQIGICADVEKAFLQIALKEQDRDVTRFLWLKDKKKAATKDNLLHLRFCGVPFGIISSPFILNATIRSHLKKSDKERIKELAQDIYVDNLVTGTQTVKEAIQLYQDSKKEFNQLSMNLREWSSNSEEVMNRIPDTCNDQEIKVLGLNWNLEEDSLQLRNKATYSKANTKRDALKTLASVYDPCGYAVPILLSAKLFIQDLWKDKVKWDTPFSEELQNKWSMILDEIKEVKDISIPRSYFRNGKKECELHCFTDSSIKAYAAVVYVVSGKEKGFVIGKSRLVPTKDQENLKIPRLELLGVLIGTRLIKYVLQFLQFKVTRQVLWTDSQIVIDWYNSNKLLPPFIARRIEEIKKNKELTIKYVPSEHNPADVATRPTNSKDQMESWLSGPNFLLDDSKTWHTNRRSELSFLIGEGLPNEEKLPSEKEAVKEDEKHLKPDKQETQIKRSTKTGQEVSSHTEEIRKLQVEFFPEEIDGRETSLKRNLGLFIDVDGILRCKGRLKYADWSYDKRYPILLPRSCDYTNNLIKQTHNDNYHVGVNHTLSIIRQQFWIPQGKRQVQKILKECPRCVKHGGGPFKLPDTPALPPERVNYSSPFTFTGIDYMGPILIKNGNETSKRWIALFTCLAVRAVHLETVKDLTAEEGLLALRRMISTRGIPQLITSDNATNFKLVSEILASPYCIRNEIRWRFIPQLAPWFGGFYERLIGIVKNCMRRTLHKHLLTDSQLSTVVKEIEAVVNSRPLTCVDTELVHILKPSDFLAIGKCITMETSQEESPIKGSTTKVDLIKSWKRGLVILDEFKDMFSNHYLLSLRERYRHSLKEPRVTSSITPKEGQIVQIKGDAKNRENWKVGSIVSLIKGTDGNSRVAKVKVGDTEFIRSINHLYPLEVEEEEPERENTVNIQKGANEIDSTQYIDKSYTPRETQMDCDGPERKNERTIAEYDVNEDTTDERKANESTTTELKGNEPNQEVEGKDDREVPAIEMLNEVESNTESTERNISEPNSEVKEVRPASAKARIKIREWTRDLMNLL